MSHRSILEALSFASHKHSTQRRQDPDASPYINHLIAVALLLATEGGVDDESILVAAILHDTVEDTKTTFEELTGQFGEAVTDLVREMTDDKSLDKAARKQLQIDHAPNASPGAKQIKIADKCCNLNDIATTPPVGWNRQRREEYIEWAVAVVGGCRGVNAALDLVFDGTVTRARGALRLVQ